MNIEINDIKKSLNQSFPDSRTRITIDLIIEKLEEFEERINNLQDSTRYSSDIPYTKDQRESIHIFQNLS